MDALTEAEAVLDAAGLWCGHAARFAITCMDCGGQTFLCTAHRVMFQPGAFTESGVWYEAVLS